MSAQHITMNDSAVIGSAMNGSTVNGSETNSPPRKTAKLNGNAMTGFNEETGVKKDEATVFLKRVFDLLVQEGVKKTSDLSSKVVDFKHPDELMEQLDLDLGDQGMGEEGLLQACRDTIRYSVRTGHPRFFNQLFSGFNEVGLAGAWLSDTINTSQYTFEAAPVFTLMEQVVLKKMRDIIGYTTGDGIFCPGGSISNMYGLNLARYRKFPKVKTDGMFGIPKVCIFISEQAHYSLKKGAALLGIGVNNVRQVPCDERGKMIPAELENMVLAAKEEGYEPFFVDATSGTTVVGAYDPLDEIADVCEKYGLWLHVDCCWGGGALLSKKYRSLLKGIERSDSIAWNPHKMMGTPLQCCAFLTKHNGMLQQCHSANATYLFQQDKFYDVSFDTGDKSIQCGRKVDVFKLWLMWKAKGNHGYEAAINNVFGQAKYLAKRLANMDGFRLVYPEPECTNVCFWYIPPSMRGQTEDDTWWGKLSKVAPVIKERMAMEGTMLIGYQPLNGKVNFFRMVVANLESTTKDMDFVIYEIDRLGRDLYSK